MLIPQLNPKLALLSCDYVILSSAHVICSILICCCIKFDLVFSLIHYVRGPDVPKPYKVIRCQDTTPSLHVAGWGKAPDGSYIQNLTTYRVSCLK